MNKSWNAFVARMESEARATLKNNRHGVCVVTAHVAVDADGNPMVWVVPGSVRVEPSNDAKNILLPLLTNSLA
jgi:hypothetical protein